MIVPITLACLTRSCLAGHNVNGTLAISSRL
jgi:hypothetical protein